MYVFLGVEEETQKADEGEGKSSSVWGRRFANSP